MYEMRRSGALSSYPRFTRNRRGTTASGVRSVDVFPTLLWVSFGRSLDIPVLIPLSENRKFAAPVVLPKESRRLLREITKVASTYTAGEQRTRTSSAQASSALLTYLMGGSLTRASRSRLPRPHQNNNRTLIPLQLSDSGSGLLGQANENTSQLPLRANLQLE